MHTKGDMTGVDEATTTCLLLKRYIVDIGNSNVQTDLGRAVPIVGPDVLVVGMHARVQVFEEDVVAGQEGPRSSMRSTADIASSSHLVTTAKRTEICQHFEIISSPLVPFWSLEVDM